MNRKNTPESAHEISRSNDGWLFRHRKLFFWLILVLLIITVLELFGWVFMRFVLPKKYSLAREILLGAEEKQFALEQNTIGQAYLLYIPAPDFSRREYGKQHNEHGYRGKAVPLERRPGVIRILCLGGSTTYGWKVGRADQTYPAILQQLLQRDLSHEFEGVEVINGGMPWGTTSELLTHYHFKYHYYRPDIVIIHTGGNDAEAYLHPHYHPDYSHWRKPMRNLRSLPCHSRWLAHSHLSSLIILTCFYHDFLHGQHFVSHSGTPPAAPWFSRNGRLLEKESVIPHEDMAFAHNLEALIRMISYDGARILLVPFRLAPKKAASPDFFTSQTARHERILKELARKYRLVLAPFPQETISPENWGDEYCHLKADGNRQKAEHIAQYVLKILQEKKPAEATP